MTPEGTAAVSAAASRRRPRASTPCSRRRPTGPSLVRSPAFRDRPFSAQAAYEATAQAASASAAQRPCRPRPCEARCAFLHRRRTLRVLKPGVYAEAEGVAKALKGGDVVILVLSETPADLVKRILDFSFGAAAALDASVECIADHVFAIAVDSGLSEVERMTLRNQKGAFVTALNRGARIVVVGGGKMGEAILGGWIASEDGAAASIGAADVTVVNPGLERREYLAERYGVSCVADVCDVEAPMLSCSP